MRCEETDKYYIHTIVVKNVVFLCETVGECVTSDDWIVAACIMV